VGQQDGIVVVLDVEGVAVQTGRKVVQIYFGV